LNGSGPVENDTRLTLTGTNAYTGTLTNNSLLIINNASMNAAKVISYSQLIGAGTLGDVTANQLRPTNGTTSTTTGIMNTGNLSVSGGGTVAFTINGATPGTQYSQVNVTGTVDIGSSEYLLMTLSTSFVPTRGQVFVLINNDGTDAITGQFNDANTGLALAEGDVITLNGAQFQISYVGGDGNDVTLACVLAPKSWTGATNNLWSGTNWAGGTPVAGDVLQFPSGAANLSMNNDLAVGTSFATISILGSGYVFAGNGIVLTNALSSSSGTSTFNVPIDIQNNAVSVSGGANVTFNGAVSGSGALTLSGGSFTFNGSLNGSGPVENDTRLTLTGTNAYTGTLTNNSLLILNNASMNAAKVISYSQLIGAGTLGDVTANQLRPTNGTTSTTTGIMNTGNLSVSGGGTVAFTINGATPGTQYSQVNVTGTVDIGSSEYLLMTLSTSFVPTRGQVFVLINNDGTDAITGQFNDANTGLPLPQGAVIRLNAVYDFQLSYLGGDGNDVTLSALNGKEPSTLALTTDLNPTALGQNVTFTATVSTAVGTPTGTVSFLSDSTPMGSAPLSSGVATFAINTLPHGIHAITAVYGGDNNFGGSTSPAVNQIVDSAPIITPHAVSLTPGTATFIDLAATVDDQDSAALLFSAIAPGGITVTNIVNTLGTMRATVVVDCATPVADYDVQVFARDAEGLISSAFVRITVTANPAPVLGTYADVNLSPGGSTTASPSAAPTDNGATITLAATTDAAFTGTLSVATSGVVSIANANSGTWTVVVTATDNCGAQSSQSFMLTVSKIATTTILATSATPANFGDTVMFTANVTSGATGSIDFNEGPTTLGSAPISSGVATFTTTSLSPGSHSIVAVYGGDAKYAASTSSALQQIINGGATTTTLTSSHNPSTFGDDVTFTANVTAGATGTVTFNDGVSSIGTIALATGTANLTTSTLTAGTHGITAVYNGDGTYSGSASAVVNQIVAPASLTITINSSANPSTFGSAIVFTANLPADATGALTFHDSAGTLGNSNLDHGTAAFVAFGLAAGSHSITASYPGDANHLPSTSAALTQTIQPLGTSMILDSLVNPSSYSGNAFFLATVIAPLAGDLPVVVGSNVIVPFRGSLFDTTDAPVKGTVSMFAAIYDGPGATIPLWSNSYTVNVVGGEFSIALGDGATIPASIFSGTQPNLRMSINGSAPLLPGIPLSLTTPVQGNSSADSYKLVWWPSPVATGSVIFRDGATTLGTSPLSVMQAIFNLSSLSVGDHPISAVYVPDPNFSASTSPTVIQHVGQAASSVVLASSANPSTYGAAVVFTAQTGVGATGTITFFDGSTALGTAPIGSGVATLSVPAMSVGSHSITASYAGDANLGASTSAVLTQVVDRAAAVVGLTSSSNPATFGTSVTFTASITNGATGTVAFLDGASTLGVVGISAGTAMFTISTLSAGTHNITVTYAGDTNFTGGTSAPVPQVVNRAVSTTLVSSSSNPSAFAGSVTFTATINSGATGTITFSDGATILGTVSVSNALATFATSALATGSHPITASYSGDANFNPSTSSVLPQVVDNAATLIGLTSSANPATFGTSITFTASITNGATGTVAFADGGSTLGVVAISGGTAMFTASTLSAGTHNITVTYGGDSNFGAASSALAQVINSAASTTTISSSSNPSGFGGSVTFTAIVTIGATGNVAFNDGATTLGSAILLNGAATFATTALSTGSHAIIAAYSGDANYNPSASSTLTQVVNPTAPTIGVIMPGAGPASGGQLVTITGANLGSATVTFGGANASVTSNNATTIVLSTPAHAAGSVDVIVTTPFGSTTSTTAYTFVAAPSITSVTPASGSAAGGETVVIRGINLGGATVAFGGTPASVSASSATALNVTTPGHASGVSDVTVTTTGGVATSPGAYTFTGCTSPAGIIAYASSTSIIAGERVVLSTTAADGTQYVVTWFGNGLQIGSGVSIAVTPSQTTRYVAVATNECGSAESAPIEVLVFPTRPAECTTTVASVSASPNPAFPAETVTLSVAATTSNGTLAYEWYRGVIGDTSDGILGSASTMTARPTAATNYWVRVTSSCGVSATGQVFVGLNLGMCGSDRDQLCLNDARYKISVLAKDPTGRTATGIARYQTAKFGSFSLPELTGDANNPEIFIKIVGPVNGVPWIFYAGLTNLDYTFTVTDGVSGHVFNTYHVPASAPGSQSSLGDFDVNGAKSARCAPVVVQSTQAEPGSCVSNDSTLCLLNRFAVSLTAADDPARSTRTDTGAALPVNSMFGFFKTPKLAGDPDDIQVFVKMVDARGPFGSFWVFLGGLTDLEYTTTITDTTNGRQKIYTKPAGSTCGWNDVNAFE
jgi:hypothetical protein